MAGASPDRSQLTSNDPGNVMRDRPTKTLPSFVVIGSAKSGTTSLCEYLGMHPQVFVSEPKEPQFFPLEFNWGRGVDWYAAHFAGAGDARAIGEGSTTYTRYPHSKGVPERMYSVLPEARLVYLVRHPIERMISQYQQHVWHGWEQERSAERALRDNPFYTDISRYATQLEQYVAFFPRDRLLVISSEQLKADREAAMRRVFAFVGVDPNVELAGLERTFNATDDKRRPRKLDGMMRRLPGYVGVASHIPEPIRKAKYRLTTKGSGPRPAISATLRKDLEDLLRDEVRRLRPYMGPEFDGWSIA